MRWWCCSAPVVVGRAQARAGLDYDEAGGPHTGTLAAVGGGAAGVLDGGDDGGVEDGARRRGQAAADALEGSGASRAGEAVEVAGTLAAVGGGRTARRRSSGRGTCGRRAAGGWPRRSQRPPAAGAARASLSATDRGQAAGPRQLHHPSDRDAQAGRGLAGGEQRCAVHAGQRRHRIGHCRVSRDARSPPAPMNSGQSARPRRALAPRAPGDEVHERAHRDA